VPSPVVTLEYFVGQCPILSPYRKKYLGKKILSVEEIIQFFNGNNWNILFSYLKEATGYR
jgi:hypothetical protein